MRLEQKPEMDRYINEAINLLELLPPSKELAMAYSHKSRMHMVVFQVNETYYWGKRAMELAEQLGDSETTIHTLANIGIVEMWHNQRAEGQKKLEQSLQLSLDHGYHHHTARALYNLAVGSIALFDYESCLVYVNEGLDYSARHDLENWKLGQLSLRARAKFEQGHWDEAEQDIRSAQEFWEDLDHRPHVELLLLRLQVRRGDHPSPESIGRLRNIALHSVYHSIVYPIAELFAELAWLEGDLAQCRAEAEPMFQIACELGIPKFVGGLGYWMWRAGAITELPAKAGEPYATQINGDWQSAALIWEDFGCPYDQGMALMDGDEAAQLKALEIFERLGAQPILQKLRGNMRAQGIRVPRGPRPATRENRFGLTGREMEVLDCLVGGSNNKEIAKTLTIAPRTVEHHIASIVRKMGVQSRFEAVAQILQEKQTHSK